MAAELGLERVEGKQHLVGEAGTEWEVDAKGVKLGDEGIVLVECKRYPTKRVDQETVGGFAYRIKDLGAAGGILVSPLGFQRGAQLIAGKEGIVEVHLDADSKPHQYVMHFLNTTFVGIPVVVPPRPSATTVTTTDGDGPVANR
ncbi:restriction endonuclease [Nocardia sp. NBC_01499]|uniref:restriction endonuclease n=1 Tax=Nocardia sp. NBC_01499 TaxID=2903597 RepID=UPI0038672B81